jgi:acyl carrier protein
MDEISLKLRAFITDNFLFGRKDENIQEEDSLIENGVIDSTGVLQLVSFIECNFGVHVEDDEIIPDNLDSLSKLTLFVSGKCRSFKDREMDVWDQKPEMSLSENAGR